MYAYRSLKRMFDGHLREAQNNNRSFAEGRLAALREFHDQIGLETDADGTPMIPLGEDGLPEVRRGRAKFKEFSLRTLAEAIMGHENVEQLYGPSGIYGSSRPWRLTEAAVDPTAFININMYNQAVAGLINAEIMERFNNPEFIVRNLFEVKPTKMNGQKLIAVGRMTAPDFNTKRRQPGEQHPEIGLRDAYQITPETWEQALKCKLTRESVFFDMTGQVEEEAGQVGHILGYQMEQDGADTVLGVTTSGSMAASAQYNRNGTSYNTYLTSGFFVNDQASNGIAISGFDATNIDTARQLFVGMRDPESNLEIQVMGKDILVFTAHEMLMRQVVYQSAMQLGTQLNSNYPAAWTMGGNYLDKSAEPWKGPYNVMTLSPIWFNRMTAANGLNLAASTAQQYWWIGDFTTSTGAGPRPFYWMENWPFTPWSAPADEYVMKDQGLIAVFGASYRGTPYVREPRKVVRNHP